MSDEAGVEAHKNVGAVHDVSIYQGSKLLGPHGTSYFNNTAPHSVAHYHGLHHVVPGGGGGISGYALPSIYQTMYWPSLSVHRYGLSGQQLGYIGMS